MGAGGLMLGALEPGDPRRLGRWRVRGRLGQGGMGVVFLGERRGHPPVAIKVLRPELCRDRDFQERFRREAQAASTVISARTAQMLEVSGEGESPYLVTEYVEGPTLLETIRSHGPLTGDFLDAFAIGVAEAVNTMSAVGVIHRDLTPGNVVLAADGPKVIDFGIARAMEASTITLAGAVLGTPAWMSPEQATGRHIGHAVDVFGWGALITFAATGHAPFGEGDAAAMVYRVVHEEPDLDGLPDHLKPLVAQSLAKDSEIRPTPSALVSQLRAGSTNAKELKPEMWTELANTVVRQRPHAAVTTPLLVSAERRASSQRRYFLAGAVAVVLLIGGLLVSGRLAKSSDSSSLVAMSASQTTNSPGTSSGALVSTDQVLGDGSTLVVPVDAPSEQIPSTFGGATGGPLAPVTPSTTLVNPDARNESLSSTPSTVGLSPTTFRPVSPVITATPTTAAQCKNGASDSFNFTGYGDRTVLKENESPQQHMIYAGARTYIGSSDDITALGLSTSPTSAPKALIDAITFIPRTGTMVREWNSPTVILIVGGARFDVTSPGIRDSLASTGDTYHEVPNGTFSRLTNRVPYEGILLRELGDSTVYQIIGGRAIAVTPCSGAKVWALPPNEMQNNGLK